jgi:hypothetical protein
MSLWRQIDESIARGRDLNGSYKLHIQKLVNVVENAFADRGILLDGNLLFFEQNNEKVTRKSIKATIVGGAKVMSHEDIVKAQKGDIKEAGAEAVRGRRRSNRKSSIQIPGKRSRSQELEQAEREIRALGIEKYCSVLDF